MEQKGIADELSLLLKRQLATCPGASAELRRVGRKSGHWLWWAFPCDVPGRSEPTPATFLTRANALDFLQRADVTWWNLITQIVANARVNHRGLRGVLPDIDLPRVRAFCQFWGGLIGVPSKLQLIVKDLIVLTDPGDGASSLRLSTALAKPSRGDLAPREETVGRCQKLEGAEHVRPDWTAFATTFRADHREVLSLPGSPKLPVRHVKAVFAGCSVIVPAFRVAADTGRSLTHGLASASQDKHRVALLEPGSVLRPTLGVEYGDNLGAVSLHYFFRGPGSSSRFIQDSKGVRHM